MTATATQKVRKDVFSMLRMKKDAFLAFASFNRPNLNYRVVFKPLLGNPVGHLVRLVKV